MRTPTQAIEIATQIDTDSTGTNSAAPVALAGRTERRTISE
jgi:hypothetical protein